MRNLSLLLISLFSLMLCLAAGCARYQEPAGTVLENISTGPSPSSGPYTPGDLLDRGPEAGEMLVLVLEQDPGSRDYHIAWYQPSTGVILQDIGWASQEDLARTYPFSHGHIPLSTIRLITMATTVPPPVITTPPPVTTPTTTLTTLPTTISTPPAGDIPHAVEQAVLRLTNDERARNNIAPLAWDEHLADVARAHSTDMAEHDFFSHTNLQGEGPTERAKRHGYPVRKDLGGGWYAEGIGENLNMMPTGNVEGFGEVTNNADSIARAQVKAWMGSPGHRALLLNSEFSRLGVGVAYDGQYYYTTQNFW